MSTTTSTLARNVPINGAPPAAAAVENPIDTESASNLFPSMVTVVTRGCGAGPINPILLRHAELPLKVAQVYHYRHLGPSRQGGRSGVYTKRPSGRSPQRRNVTARIAMLESAEAQSLRRRLIHGSV